MGRRLQQTVSGIVTDYLLDPRGILAQEGPNGDWLWMTKDGLGSVRDVYSNAVTSLDAVDYTPYGEPLGVFFSAPIHWKAIQRIRCR